MKKSKLTILVTMVIMTFSTAGVAHAAGSSKDIPVTYDNTLIPDPDNPGTATWGVALPGKVMFSDNAKTVTGLDVTLKGMNGYDIADGLSVGVTVKSSNSYNVKYNDTMVAYTLSYDTTVLSGAAPSSLSALTKDSPSKKGEAKLTGTTTVQGLYSDTLTYTVQKNP